MKTSTNLNTSVLFYINNKPYAGFLEIAQGKQIQGTFLTNSRINESSLLESFEADTIHLIIKDDSLLATLFQCEIINSHYSTVGLYEYTIYSDMLVTGDHYMNESELKIRKLAFVNNDFSGLIGASLIKFDDSSTEAKYNLMFENESIGPVSTFANYIAYLRSFHNGFTIRKTDLNVHQSNSLVFEFNEEQPLSRIRSFLLHIELLFSVIFQHPSINEEVVFIDPSDKPVKEHHHHFYFKRKKFKEYKSKLNRQLFPVSELIKNIFKYINNWECFIADVPYFKRYILSYYTTTFIDQQVLGQLFLLNCIHPYFYGRIKHEENQSLIDNIRASSLSQDDQDFIINRIQSKSGYGFRKMLKDLFERYKIAYSTKDINSLNSYRSSQAHGGSHALTPDEYVRFDTLLSLLIQNIVKEVVNKTST